MPDMDLQHPERAGRWREIDFRHGAGVVGLGQDLVGLEQDSGDADARTVGDIETDRERLRGQAIDDVAAIGRGQDGLCLRRTGDTR